MEPVQSTVQTEAAAPEVAKKLEQKEFIFQAIKESVVLQEGQSYYEALNTKSEHKATASKLRKEIRAKLFEAMKAGLVKCKKDTSDEKALRNYASLCVSHWINKDARLK